MQSEKEGLDRFRREIDEIDDQIHDLLMRRTEIVHEVARVKNRARKVSEDEHLVPSLAMRPEREAAILRRLKDRHRGELPFHVISQLWRELINAKTRLQGPMSVALYRGNDGARDFDARDLARAYYGAASPLKLYDDAFSALDDVVRNAGVIGILPIPVAGESDPWWPHLLAFDGINPLGGPRIVLRLPFLIHDSQAPDYPEAMTIACMDQAPSGDDRSLFIAVCAAGVLERDVRAQGEANGLSFEVIDLHDGADARLFLLESPAFVAVDDPRLSRVSEGDGPVRQLRSIGGYAAPIKGTD
jgi:chorismate mutase-like protein